MINEWLREQSTYIVNHRGAGSFTDEYYDLIRLTIETASELAPDGATDPFLVTEFAKDELWGADSEEAKYKLISYIVIFLSKCGGDKSLRYLLTIITDQSRSVQRYIKGTCSPEPIS